MRNCNKIQQLPPNEARGEGWRGKHNRVVALYRQGERAIYRRALKLLGDPEEALDVTQEAFISLLPQLSRLQNDSAALGWLYQVATYQAISRLKRRVRWSARLAQLAPPGQEEEDPEAHETDVRRVEAARQLALLTKEASSQAITAALFYFVEGYTLEEVGAKLGRSRKTVRRMMQHFCETARKREARFQRAGAHSRTPTLASLNSEENP